MWDERFMSMVTTWESGVYHLLPTTQVYSLASHNDVSVNDGGPIILYYNITLTAVLQLPAVFSTVTCCTGL
jgi:hypothetical protein